MYCIFYINGIQSVSGISVNPAAGLTEIPQSVVVEW